MQNRDALGSAYTLIYLYIRQEEDLVLRIT